MARVKQRDRFAHGEGDAFHLRNRATPDGRSQRVAHDLLLAALDALDLRAKSVLEIGAGDGWRLSALREREQAARYVGIEPSALALADSAAPGVCGVRATADALPLADASFDLVVFGFCLYLVDRSDLFRIAAEADRVLSEGGTLVIYDFYTAAPQRRRYAHADACFSFKMDYAQMFAWNPAYRVVLERRAWHAASTQTAAKAGDDDAEVRVVALRRDTQAGWPLRDDA
jgi:SAM-dependent methyltransferase